MKHEAAFTSCLENCTPFMMINMKQTHHQSAGSWRGDSPFPHRFTHTHTLLSGLMNHVDVQEAESQL